MQFYSVVLSVKIGQKTDHPEHTTQCNTAAQTAVATE